MASAAAIVAPTASPISSSKYGSCQLSGDPMTPSSATNSDATTSSTTRRKPARQQVRPVVQHLGAPPFLRSDADRGRGPYPSARRAYGPSYRTRIDSTFLESCQDGGAGADPANNRGFCRTLGEQSKGGQFGQASHPAHLVRGTCSPPPISPKTPLRSGTRRDSRESPACRDRRRSSRPPRDARTLPFPGRPRNAL